MCLDAVRAALGTATTTIADTSNASESPFSKIGARVRLSTSRFKQLLQAQNTKWKLTDWDEQEVHKQRTEILASVEMLIKADCAARNASYEPKGRKFYKELCDVAESEKLIERMAVRLWTSPATLQDRELCFMINDAIRADDEARVTRAEDETPGRLAPATTLATMIQRHLKIGYNRAARIVDQMESRGVVGPADGARAREVLI